MLIASQLEERGGEVESVEITAYDGTVSDLPKAQPQTHTVTERLLNGLLGRALTDEEVQTAMNRMGGTYLGRSPVENAPAREPENMADVVIQSCPF